MSTKVVSKGFTLIELLVTISIIAILMSLALVSYESSRKSARDGRRKTDLSQIQSALEMCRADCGSYPVSAISSGGTITSSGCGCSSGSVTYMTIPADPLTTRRYYYAPVLSGTMANSYCLYAALEGAGGFACGAGNSNCGSACNYSVAQP